MTVLEDQKLKEDLGGNQTVDLTGEVFKIVSQERSILSYKTNRDAYNSMINIPASYDKATALKSSSNAQKRNYSTSSSTRMKNEKVPKTCNKMRVSQERVEKSFPITSSMKNEGYAYPLKTYLGSITSKTKIFWTSCDKCKFKFEYNDNL
ncbi:hypothetical protein M9H77_09475 [Catharanthus roseus]|uniref:Uncharacterized protein n=1 Tax=Catharanthus roseus TaxID=4058 RepID=A0ACC0C0W0_CATRO|nr:hypothetical protein M9H77_09475 [Catharanthus roseus]